MFLPHVSCFNEILALGLQVFLFDEVSRPLRQNAKPLQVIDLQGFFYFPLRLFGVAACAPGSARGEPISP